jgi:hypothetical protein
MKPIRPGRDTQWFIVALGLAIAVSVASLSAFPPTSLAQNTATPTATTPETNPLGLPCTDKSVRNSVPTPDPLNGQKDPFLGQLVGPSLPPDLLPIKEEIQKSIFAAPLLPPCQEGVSPLGQEKVGLDNLQRGFDFYSWRTFIALNLPTNGTPIEKAQANDPTLWENMNSFKQLADVMLEANQLPPKWPTDTKGMEDERKRLMPKQCSDLHVPDESQRMVVKMIEESFNEPFKTGPLIDQNGHYAIFDILMNRQMFNYIMANHLNTKAGQAANSELSVDFPAGQNKNNDLGAFMLKVSWKILADGDPEAKHFHTVKALVLTPPIPDEAAQKCFPETLGLIGFHAVHKTASRPQWIWTSFEHVKNVPDRDEVTAKKFNPPYNFYSVDCKGACTENATPRTPWDPDPNPLPKRELKFRPDDSFKSQIVRETPVTPAAKNMNAIFQSMLANSVWKNYMLISTQWPSAFGCASLHSKTPGKPDPRTDFFKQPDMTCSPAPTFLANSTLETYSQRIVQGGVEGDVPLASSSCIACHSNAVGFQRTASNPQAFRPNLNQSDFTFILEKAK